MNVICSICSDQLMQSDDVFHTQCGHVFHLHCLTPWLDRSKSCPQCREKVTQSRIHRLYFTFSSNDAVESQGATLQETVRSLKFQIKLKEKDIQYYCSKSVTLEKQCAGLKQEVRRVESEFTKKNSAIYALKEQINYFKEQSSHCDSLKREIAKLKNEIEDLRPIQVLLHAPLSDVSKLVGRTKDLDTLTMYVSVMKKELIERFAKCKQLRMTVKKLQEELSSVGAKSDTLTEEQSKRMDLEEKLAISESKNIALQKRVDELEEILDINEKCSTMSEVEPTESKTNVSKEGSREKVSKKDNERRSKDCSLNHAVKRKAQKTSVHSTKSIEDKLHGSDLANDIRDSDIDFANCSSSKTSPIVSKRLKLSENDGSLSINSDNKISNCVSKKKRKNNVRKKVSDNEMDRVSHMIDLT